MIIEKTKIQLVKEGEMEYSGSNIGQPKDVVNTLYRYLEGADREYLGVITLNTKNIPINITTVSIGSLNSSIAHPREIFKTAILSNAASIIIFHNHPSGNPSPSNEDINISIRIKECGKILGIELLDSIIIGNKENDGFFSLKDKEKI